MIPKPKAIIIKSTNKIATPMGIPRDLRVVTRGLLITAIKIASKKGIKISSAARIPAITTIKAAEAYRICWDCLEFLLIDFSTRHIL